MADRDSLPDGTINTADDGSMVRRDRGQGLGGEARRTSKERGKGACKTRTTLNTNQRLGGAPGGFIAGEGKAFDPYEDGSGIMRDAQTAKPQTFRTDDGWFAHDLTINLAQM